MNTRELAALPALPHDADGPVFREPWEAQAFALTLTLYEAGCFTWSEWADALSVEIKRAQAAGDPDLGDTYYRHWLAALEKLVATKGMLTLTQLAERKQVWAHAADHTPHGQPIVLPPA